MGNWRSLNEVKYEVTKKEGNTWLYKFEGISTNREFTIIRAGDEPPTIRAAIYLFFYGEARYSVVNFYTFYSLVGGRRFDNNIAVLEKFQDCLYANLYLIEMGIHINYLIELFEDGEDRPIVDLDNDKRLTDTMWGENHLLASYKRRPLWGEDEFRSTKHIRFFPSKKGETV